MTNSIKSSRANLVWAAVLLCGVGLGFALNQYAVGQYIPPEGRIVVPLDGMPPPTGPMPKFQLCTHQSGGVSSMFILNTQTGEVWRRDTHSETRDWTRIESPVPPPVAPKAR